MGLGSQDVGFGSNQGPTPPDLEDSPSRSGQRARLCRRQPGSRVCATRPRLVVLWCSRLFSREPDDRVVLRFGKVVRGFTWPELHRISFETCSPKLAASTKSISASTMTPPGAARQSGCAQESLSHVAETSSRRLSSVRVQPTVWRISVQFRAPRGPQSSRRSAMPGDGRSDIQPILTGAANSENLCRN